MRALLWTVLVIFVLRTCARLGSLATGIYPRTERISRRDDAVALIIWLVMAEWCAWELTR